MATEEGPETAPDRGQILFVEPFYAGSHRQLITTLMQGLQLDGRQCRLVTMSGRKWHWRARTSALYLAETIPAARYRLLFTSSVTPLAELCGLRPDLAAAHKVLYFHENQLVYPVRKQADTDFQYGYNQITACLVADQITFNSKYNMESFLENVDHFMKTQPDYRPKGLAEKIRPKCGVLHFPLCLPDVLETKQVARSSDPDPLHILWPHRWEHDKNPALFFETLERLHEEGLPFRLSVLGERYEQVPDVFERARHQLQDHILNWGYVESKDDYWKVLMSADVVVSTAHHEFFGVAVLEAVAAGCQPLCVDAVVYPEWFERRHLFRTAGQLLKRLRQLCRRPALARAADPRRLAAPFSWPALRPAYCALLRLPAATADPSGGGCPADRQSPAAENPAADQAGEGDGVPMPRKQGGDTEEREVDAVREAGDKAGRSRGDSAEDQGAELAGPLRLGEVVEDLRLGDEDGRPRQKHGVFR